MTLSLEDASPGNDHLMKNNKSGTRDGYKEQMSAEHQLNARKCVSVSVCVCVYNGHRKVRKYASFITLSCHLSPQTFMIQYPHLTCLMS